MAESHILKVEPRVDDRQYQKKMNDISSRLKRLSNSFTSTGKSMMTAGAFATAGITYPLLRAGKASVKAAADMERTENVINSVFRGRAGEIREFADELSNLSGMFRGDILKSAKNLGAMFRGFGFAEDDVINKTKELQPVILDFAMAFGDDFETAARRFRRGIAGSAELLDDYGINIKEAAVNTELLAMGYEGGASKADMFEKTLAKINLIMKQANQTGMVGTATRLYDSYTGSLLRFNSAVKELQVEVGKRLLKPMAKLMDNVKNGIKWFLGFNDKVQKTILIFAGIVAILPVVITLVGAVATAIGFLLSPVGLVIAAIGGLAYIFMKQWESAKKYILPVINFLIDMYNQSLILKIGVAALAFVFASVGDVANAVFKTIVAVFKRIPTIIGALIKDFGKLLAIITAFATGNFNVGKALVNAFIDGGSDVTKVIADIGEETGEAWGTAMETMDEALTDSIGMAFTKVEHKTEEDLDNMRDGIFDKIKEIMDSLRSKLGDELQIKPYEGMVDKDSSGGAAEAVEELNEITQSLNEAINGMVVNTLSSIPEAFVMHNSSIKRALNTVAGVIGQGLVQLGQLMIAYGVNLEVFKNSIKSMNPMLAVAAGAALIAIGTAIKKSSANVLNGGKGGGGSANSSSASDGSNFNDFLDAIQGETVFRVNGDDLIAVTNRANKRQRFIGS
jgi:hypothetical protein